MFYNAVIYSYEAHEAQRTPAIAASPLHKTEAVSTSASTIRKRLNRAGLRGCGSQTSSATSRRGHIPARPAQRPPHRPGTRSPPRSGERDRQQLDKVCVVLARQAALHLPFNEGTERVRQIREFYVMAATKLELGGRAGCGSQMTLSARMDTL